MAVGPLECTPMIGMCAVALYCAGTTYRRKFTEAVTVFLVASIISKFVKVR